MILNVNPSLVENPSGHTNLVVSIFSSKFCAIPYRYIFKWTTPYLKKLLEESQKPSEIKINICTTPESEPFHIMNEAPIFQIQYPAEPKKEPQEFENKGTRKSLRRKSKVKHFDHETENFRSPAKRRKNDTDDSDSDFEITFSSGPTPKKSRRSRTKSRTEKNAESNELDAKNSTEESDPKEDVKTEINGDSDADCEPIDWTEVIKPASEKSPKSENASQNEAEDEIFSNPGESSTALALVPDCDNVVSISRSPGTYTGNLKLKYQSVLKRLEVVFPSYCVNSHCVSSPCVSVS